MKRKAAAIKPLEMESPARDLSKEYSQMMADREPFLRRARDCALVTIPSLMPPEGHNGDHDYPTPNQAIGAQGLNNISNQLLNSLFPPQAPNFRLTVDDETLVELAQDATARAAVEERLASFERMIKARTDMAFPRAAALYTVKLLVATGNALVVLRDDNTVRVHRLDQFVIRRDGGGRMIKAIVREEVHPTTLPEDVRQRIKDAPQTSGEAPKREENVVVFTCYERQGDRIKTYQTVKGILIPGSEGNWPLDVAPILALRWAWADGEDYGRSYVDEYLGDLEAAEGLAKAIRESAAAAAKVVILVNPNGVTREVDIAEAENLDVLTGRQDDVTMLQLNKQADMQIAQTVLKEIERRLSQAFVMHLGVRRDADRVTAEETRMVIMALESALGGTYALFAQDLQLPLVRIFMSRLEKEGKLPKLPKGGKDGPEIQPQITTGVEALGRGEDFNRYSTFVTSLMQTLGPEQVAQFINVPDFIKRMGASLNIDMNGLVKTQEQIAQERQEAMAMQQEALMQQTMASAAEKAAPVAAKAMMGE